MGLKRSQNDRFVGKPSRQKQCNQLGESYGEASLYISIKKMISTIKTIILNNSNAGHRKDCLMWVIKLIWMG